MVNTPPENSPPSTASPVPSSWPIAATTANDVTTTPPSTMTTPPPTTTSINLAAVAPIAPTREDVTDESVSPNTSTSTDTSVEIIIGLPSKTSLVDSPNTAAASANNAIPFSAISSVSSGTFRPVPVRSSRVEVDSEVSDETSMRVSPISHPPTVPNNSRWSLPEYNQLEIDNNNNDCDHHDQPKSIRHEVDIKCSVSSPRVADFVPFISLMKNTIDNQLERARKPSSKVPPFFRRYRPMGLSNLGNTCWFNSVLQALFCLPSIKRFFINLRLPIQLLTEDFEVLYGLSASERVCVRFLVKLRKLFIAMQDPTQDVARPFEALDEFRTMGKFEKSDFSQEDASEAFTHLIEKIETAINCLIEKIPDVRVTSHLKTMKASFMKSVFGKVASFRNGLPAPDEVFRELNVPLVDSVDVYDALYRLWLEVELPPEPNESSTGGTTSSSQPARVASERWICEQPDIMFICLNRYKFSNQTKQVVKICDQFPFPDLLFIDRYMLKNREGCRARRIDELEYMRVMTELSEQRDVMQQSIRGIEGRTSPVRAILQAKSIIHSAAGVAKQYTNWTQQQETQLDISLDFIGTLIDWYQSKLDSIIRDSKAMATQITHLYDIVPLRQHPYRLQAICVHRGRSNRGHYWTYIRNHSQNSWYKCNDSEVSPTRYEEVRLNSIGSPKFQSNNNGHHDHRATLASIDHHHHHHNHHETGSSSSNNELYTQESIPCAYLLIYVRNEDFNDDEQINAKVTGEIESATMSGSFSEAGRSFSSLMEKAFDECRVLRADPVLNELASIDYCTNAFVVTCLAASFESLLKRTIFTPTDIEACLEDFMESANYELYDVIETHSQHHYGFDDRLTNFALYITLQGASSEIRRIAILDMLKSSASFQKTKPGFTYLQLRAEAAFRRAMPSQAFRDYQFLLGRYKRFLTVVACLIHGSECIKRNQFTDGMHYFCVAKHINRLESDEERWSSPNSNRQQRQKPQISSSTSWIIECGNDSGDLSCCSETPSFQADLNPDLLEDIFAASISMAKEYFEAELEQNRSITEQERINLLRSQRIEILPCLGCCRQTHLFDFDYFLERVQETPNRANQAISDELKNEIRLLSQLVDSSRTSDRNSDNDDDDDDDDDDDNNNNNNTNNDSNSNSSSANDNTNDNNEDQPPIISHNHKLAVDLTGLKERAMAICFVLDDLSENQYNRSARYSLNLSLANQSGGRH